MRFDRGTTKVRKDWLCHQCCLSPAKTGAPKLTTEEKLAAKNLKLRFDICKDYARRLWVSRKRFLVDQRALLEPFCDPAALDRLSSGADTAPLVAAERSVVTPPYIQASLRDYQLDGVNCMYEWYLRGVGGILADEM